jgi:hypothetical protein
MSAGIEADDATLVAIAQSSTPKRRTMKVKTNIKAGRKAGGDPSSAGKPF